MKKRQFRLIVTLACMLCCAAVLISLYLSANTLTCTHYTLSSEKIRTPIRIVQLTDLHNEEFGEDNEQLLRLVAQQEPDLILLTGDMLNGDEADTETLKTLLAGLAEIAPVYASMGNHEKGHAKMYGTDLKELHEQAGVTWLERSYVDIEVNGQALRLAGLFGYALSERYLFSGEAKADECEFLKEFEDTPRYTILLCHYPLSFIQNKVLEDWTFDCVFSGHFHGGLIRLPGIGGVYAPDMGFFPGEMSGLFFSEDQKRVMVLSRGLSNSSMVPRLNNIPEVVVADLVAQE